MVTGFVLMADGDFVQDPAVADASNRILSYTYSTGQCTSCVPRNRLAVCTNACGRVDDRTIENFAVRTCVGDDQVCDFVAP